MEYGTTENTETPGAPALPAAGDYDMVVIEAEPRLSQAGSPMVVIRMRSTDQPSFEIKEYLVDTKNAKRYTDEKLVALGHPVDSPDGISAEKLIGRRVRVTIGHEEYRGEQCAKVRRLAPAR